MANDTSAPATTSSVRNDPAQQALWTLRIGFTVLPLVFGIDKFANVLTGDWTKYLAHQILDIEPFNAATTMHIVGVIEIVAALVVALAPRIGGPLVGVWLLGIIVNLLMVRGYGDVALRDFGLLVAAITLSRLAWTLPGRLFGEFSAPR